MNKLTPDELTHLSRIAAMIRAATPGLVYTVENEAGIDENTGLPWKATYGVVRAPTGRIMTSVNKDYLGDGELFAAARGEIAWLLRLVERLDND